MLDPSDDFVSVSDGAEAVTLLRRGSTSGVAGTGIAHALRRAITAGQAAIISRGDTRKSVASSGQYMAADLVWHLPIAELTDTPRLGDVILDSDNQRWTILEVKRATLGSRWRCSTRNVVVAFGLDDTISVLKETGVPDTWRTWRTGVRARIQPIETKVDNDDESPSTTTRYRVFVEEELEVDHTCLIRGPNGTLYTINNAVGAERIGELQVIEVQVAS